MKIIYNTGTERLIDLLRSHISSSSHLDFATQTLSLFAFSELSKLLNSIQSVRLLLPPTDVDLALLGNVHDRPFRNKLQSRWLAKQIAVWIQTKASVRRVSSFIPQGTIVIRDDTEQALLGILGSFSFNTDGLGITPGNPLNLIQVSETSAESSILASWFEQQWSMISEGGNSINEMLGLLSPLIDHRAPMNIYALILQHLFGQNGNVLDEDTVINAATGIRSTVVWNKLFKFQRDGVVGAIDKLNRFGGCIIADSVGLGKTFQALAVIKYYELRNDRVLVLCPKRLRENWTLYTANDRRNIFASDRFNYDVLNHTDLSRDDGLSGDIDLSHINWGNYDLVVIDESHNFRNKKTPRQGGETRYDRLMRQIIREGVKTRVLMLSATPVNNRLADLRNQIAFATEGDDAALAGYGIISIDSTTQRAQRQFNRWLDLEESERTPVQLVEMLGFDYFALLDHLTIARSRRHIEKYYGTGETGHFPERLRPLNYKTDIDSAGEFRSIRDINQEIRRLNLASYAPMRYVLPHRQAAYDAKYNTTLNSGKGIFRQIDREESLIHLLRVNVLKRLESSIHSFAMTIQRQLDDVVQTINRIESQSPDIDTLSIDDVDIDDPTFESLLVGRKIKVLLHDVDLIRWKQDLIEDRNRLQTLLSAAQQITVDRDAKLMTLRNMIAHKIQSPINSDNRKIIIFTAFADTARYLYDQIAGWAGQSLGVNSALVTGTGHNQTTIRSLRKDLASILTAFAPRSKERPVELSGEGEVDILIATDCISEGQNLQDCDWLINYDIHWNPVRIIQRFGRIDRIGSPNECIQLVNFWPNMELEEYINLEQRVSGRMVLLDISATGEENLIEQQSGNTMNDLEYRRTQLLRLQDAVIDLEDLSTGVSITDLTLTDFRIDLAEYLKSYPSVLMSVPFGVFAVTTSYDASTPPGILFCLRAEDMAAQRITESGYPLAPYYLVYVGDDSRIVYTHMQLKQNLDALKLLSIGRPFPDSGACDRFDRATKNGDNMQMPQHLLRLAVASIVGKNEERAIASLFSLGGTHAIKGEFAGVNDFEVIAFLVVLPKGSV